MTHEEGETAMNLNDPAELERIQAVCDAATAGPWTPHRLGNGDGTPCEGEQIKQEVLSMLDKTIAHGDSQEHAFMVTAGEPLADDFVLTALTANGPTSHINADFIALARTALPLAIAALRERAWKPIAEAKRHAVKDNVWLLGVNMNGNGPHTPFLMRNTFEPSEQFTHAAPGACWEQMGRDWPCYPTHFVELMPLPAPPQQEGV